MLFGIDIASHPCIGKGAQIIPLGIAVGNTVKDMQGFRITSGIDIIGRRTEFQRILILILVLLILLLAAITAITTAIAAESTETAPEILSAG